MLNKDDVADDLQNAILGQGGLAMDAGKAWLQSARFTVMLMQYHDSHYHNQGESIVQEYI